MSHDTHASARSIARWISATIRVTSIAVIAEGDTLVTEYFRGVGWLIAASAARIPIVMPASYAAIISAPRFSKILRARFFPPATVFRRRRPDGATVEYLMEAYQLARRSEGRSPPQPRDEKSPRRRPRVLALILPSHTNPAAYTCHRLCLDESHDYAAGTTPRPRAGSLHVRPGSTRDCRVDSLPRSGYGPESPRYHTATRGTPLVTSFPTSSGWYDS